MFEEYLLCLFKQYCDASGSDINDINNMFSKEFVNWVEQNNSMLRSYLNYLNYLGFSYPVEDVLEIGKGKYDSISECGVSMVSMFAETTGKPNSKLFVDKGVPFVLKKSKIIIPSEHIILTHNPYFDSEILEWSSIHNVGEKNISVGVFGKLSDENEKRKVELLKQLASNMKDDYCFDYDTYKGEYFSSLNSKRHIKTIIIKR